MSVAPDLPSVEVSSRRPHPGQAVVIPFPRPARATTAEIIPLPVRPADLDAPADPDMPSFLDPYDLTSDPDLDAGSEAASQARRHPAGAPPVGGRRDEAPVARPRRDRHPAGLRLPRLRFQPVAQARPAVRLTRRGRLVATTVATLAIAGLLTVAGIALGGGAPAAATGSGGPATVPAAVVVQPGDTLWTIAQRVAPDRDTRQVVDDLRRLNSLPTSDLQAGQRLLVRP
jgi:nucleoid-associated protein YgaU